MADLIPSPDHEQENIRFSIPAEFLPALKALPWEFPLESWEDHGVIIVPVKSGLSRHIVRFLEAGGRRFAVKETTPPAAAREFSSYLELAAREIPTLSPVGIVTRDEGSGMVDTKVGWQIQPRETGYLVTALMDKVVPDAYLFRRAFKKDSRTRIWDAVIQLFVRLHSNGVYWGDASLSNMLIHFSTEVVPQLGRRTRLRAVLADAETVEIHPSVSDTLRLADVEFFLESMQWTEADLRASGVVREPVVTPDDRAYFVETYRDRFAVELEMRAFELVTKIDVDKLLGDFDSRGYGKLLLQHIQEHKWYLSERRGHEIALADAAHDWYAHIFKPVCKIFSDQGLLEYFPDKTAASLYVEIMEHKYFMSEREKKDVGLAAALEDYCSTFGEAEPFRLTIGSIARAITSLFRHDVPRPPNSDSR